MFLSNIIMYKFRSIVHKAMNHNIMPKYNFSLLNASKVHAVNFISCHVIAHYKHT